MKTFFVLLFLPIIAFSYVENVSKGYANCMACHISPSGGGILSDYGRSLSRELSTFKAYEGFEDPFFGLTKNTENLKWGGHIRQIQVVAENDQARIGRNFTMQNNVEFAYKYHQAFLVGTIGTQEGPDSIDNKGEYLSEVHYVLLESSESSRVRIGKFKQLFGINDANHTRINKAQLGFGSNSESYNIEYTQFTDWGELNLSQSLGNFFDDDEYNSSEKNLALNLTHYGDGDARHSISLLSGKNSTTKRNLYGISSVFNFWDKGVGRSEIDYQESANLESSRWTRGIYGSHLYGYYIYNGVLPYLIIEHAHADLDDDQSMTQSSGTGLQWFVISHLELQFEYQNRVRSTDYSNDEDRFFAMAHIYY